MKRRSFRQELIVLLALALCCAGLFYIPAPAPAAVQEGQLCRAKVLSADNSALQQHGLLLFGTQRLTVRLQSGPEQGKVYQAANGIRANMELDKSFAAGDSVIVSLRESDTPEQSVLTAKDYDRSGWFWALAGIFFLLLCFFGGWVGGKALLSFIFSCLVIWKAVIPLALRGWPAGWTIFGCVCLLTAAIQFLIAGFNRKGLAAFLGAITGILAGLGMAHLFTVLMKINGATMPYSQTLFYSGYDFLNLQDIFIGALILASSGAVMDLAMDIAAGVSEIALHAPRLSAGKLIVSGMNIGRSVVGTMTTTLLLAYSGGYITLLMMFCVQGTPPLEFINNPLVASEAVKTLIGSFSLVLVAPLTALFSGLLLCGGRPAGAAEQNLRRDEAKTQK